jgi:ADP-ribose pyrophosphatase YjhB (NUDIX family)
VPDSGYATPKVDLRAGVIQENKILLAREISDGMWSLPGGWADVGESPVRGIEREVFEETGFTVKVKRLIAIKDRSLHPYLPPYPHHIYKLFFLCDLRGGVAGESIEISEVGFFNRHEIPPLSESRSILQDIQMMFANFDDETLPVFCD